jgi:uncharacterized OB-fold protein
MGQPIAYPKGEAECPSCLNQFIATIPILYERQRETEVTCPECSTIFFFPIEYRRMGSGHPAPGGPYPQGINDQKGIYLPKGSDNQNLGIASRCGNCRAHLVRSNCPKCGAEAKDYVEPSFEVPKSLKSMANMFFILGLFFVFFIVVSLYSFEDVSSIMSLVFSAGAGFFFAFFLVNKMDQIRKKGLAGCFWCGKMVSPKSKYCIFCGKRIMWYWSKKVYAAVVITIVLVLLLIMAVVAIQPVSLSIEEVDFPSSATGNTIPVTVTLRCIGTKVAQAEKIEIEIEGVGIETARFTWPEDIEGTKYSTQTFTVNIEGDYQFITIFVSVYYEGDREDVR